MFYDVYDVSNEDKVCIQTLCDQGLGTNTTRGSGPMKSTAVSIFKTSGRAVFKRGKVEGDKVRKEM